MSKASGAKLASLSGPDGEDLVRSVSRGGYFEIFPVKILGYL